MFGFADPWQFLWTLSLLVLTAIYLWWRKSAIYTTSALFLWDSPLAAPKSGRKLKVAKLPLSFYLESLILMALILALAAIRREAPENADAPQSDQNWRRSEWPRT